MSNGLARSGLPGLDYLLGGGFPPRHIYPRPSPCPDRRNERHVETVLRLVDARRPFLAHVGSHDRLVADFEPAMHEPVLLFGRDGHVRRTFAVRHCRLNLAAQHSGIKLERLPALSLKRQARHDLHGIVSWPEGSILDVLTFE